jgi:hypothetical protein
VPFGIAANARRAADPLGDFVAGMGWVEFSLSAAERIGEQLRQPTQVPVAMAAADGVVMGDRAAKREDRFWRRDLDLIPVLQFPAVTAQCEDRVIQVTGRRDTRTRTGIRPRPVPSRAPSGS